VDLYHRTAHLGKSGLADYYDVTLQNQQSIRSGLRSQRYIRHSRYDTLYSKTKLLGLLHAKYMYEYNTVHV